MPSPFPGMDPYLEGPLWTTVHTQLTAEIARQLAPKLRPRYLALSTERFVIEVPDDVAVTTSDLYPDVGVLQAGPMPFGGREAGIATAPLRLATVMPSRVPHVTVEVRDVEHRQLVTAIEVLSPTNKRGEGREEYLRRRRRLLLSAAHLLEIDCLREGQRVPMQGPLPPAPYFVFLSRAEGRPITEVWPIPLDAPLPVVPVPLLPGDPDVPLDLQLALTTLYDLLGYDLAVDYKRPPRVPLRAEAAAWAEAHLRAAGLRS
jgi:Protein of unknown function (DUF4058)